MAEQIALRPINVIAVEIKRRWDNVYFGAVPYLQAMFSLRSVEDNYGLDSGSSVVEYFLANAQSFRGPDARRIKAELKEHLGNKLTKAEREALAAWRQTLAAWRQAPAR